MKMLGIIIDNNLKWLDHINYLQTKISQVNFGLRVQGKYLGERQMKTIMNSVAYSILYNEATVWLTPTLHRTLQTKLL